MSSETASIPDKRSAQQTTELHEAEQSNPLEDVYRPDVDTSNVDERRLIRRIDWHVVPWLAVLYLLNFLDRGSIGNAKVGFSYDQEVSVKFNPYSCII